MFLYRDHRGGLAESMDTAREFESRDELVLELQKIIDGWGKGGLDCTKLTIEPCGYDDRIEWDTYIVHLEGWGVFGFTDGPADA